MPSTTATTPWVLDTNVVLDWLVFDDPLMRAVAAPLREARALWACTAPMLDEALEVVARPAFARLGPAAELRERIVRAHAVHAQIHAPAPVAALHCADPDDQMFIDLALHLRGALLLTRDKALLALAAPAATRGVRVAAPGALLGMP